MTTATLPGKSRTIVVEPVEAPREEPAPDEPAREPVAPEREREPGPREPAPA
jgi:hypothetical protein